MGALRGPEPLVVKHQSLLALLRERAAQEPDRPCVGFLTDGEASEVRWTHAELDARARAIAVTIRAHAERRERVAIVYPPGIDFFAGFFGCIYAGVTAVPAPPPNPAQLLVTLPRLLTVLRDARTRVVLATQAIVEAVPQLAQHVPALDEFRWVATDQVAVDAAAEWREPEVAPTDLAYLQYTSGSTAAPKGVMSPHSAIMANLAQLGETFRIGREGVVFMWLPTFHNFGLVAGFLQPLYEGCPVTFMSPLAFLEKPSRWLRGLSRLRATATGGPSFAFDLCARTIPESECEGLDLSAVRVMGCGAEPVRAGALMAFAKRFERYGFRSSAYKPAYGLTEATIIASAPREDAPPRVLKLSARALEQHRVELAPAEDGAADGTSRELVSNGRALSGERLEVVDLDRLAPCAPDRIGEIWLSGPNIAPGYWSRPAETASTFRARLADGRGPFLRTGDLGFVHDGELFIAGRIKEMIIVRGHHHHPQDLEATVERSHPAVRSFGSAAFALEGEQEERLAVAVEIDPRAAAADPEQVAAAVREAVAREHDLQVHAVLLLPAGALPRSASNKIQRHAVRDGYLRGFLLLVAASVLPPDRSDAPLEA